VLAYEVENARLPGGPSVSGMDRENMTTATLPLEALYQRGPRVRRADAEVRATEADARATRQQVSLDAAHAFYRTALAQVSAAVAGDIARWLDSVVAYNRTRVQAGVAAEADLLRSELERDRAAADATLEEAELARARAGLAAFLGDLSSSSMEIIVALDDAPLAFPGALPVASVQDTRIAARTADLTSDMLERRPDVRAARERVVATRAGTVAEQRMIVRQLGATFGIKQSAGVNSMIAGVSVPFPLFDQNRGELARASAEYDAATFELATRERLARADLAGATAAARLLSDRATLLARRDTASNRVATYLARADEARAIALGAYEEGAVPLLQVLDAARAWGEARLAYYRIIYAQHEAVLALAAARGDDIASVYLFTITSPSGARR
jgi:cobalt-zinc-cadmium efflux system outer membrane protein